MKLQKQGEKECFPSSLLYAHIALFVSSRGFPFLVLGLNITENAFLHIEHSPCKLPLILDSSLFDVSLTPDHAADNKIGLGKVKESLSRPSDANLKQTPVLLVTLAITPTEHLLPKGTDG